ncbi:MAG TPA: hypothetical protein VMS53_10570 [Burkholderiales bacterium]|nr:hypothetical protein [Burkholderiales bacterium]
MRESGRRTGTPRRGLALLACGFVIALAAQSAGADPNDELSQLRKEAAELRQKQDQLDAKIRALEPQSPASPAQAAAARPEAASKSPDPILVLKQNWSQIEPGTTREKVQSLVGLPEKVLRIDGSTVWYYAYPGIGKGSVFFTESGKVSSLQSPGFGW